MKKIYELPLAEISLLSAQDVIATSDTKITFSDNVFGSDVDSYKLTDLS